MSTTLNHVQTSGPDRRGERHCGGKFGCPGQALARGVIPIAPLRRPAGVERSRAGGLLGWRAASSSRFRRLAEIMPGVLPSRTAGRRSLSSGCALGRQTGPWGGFLSREILPAIFCARHSISCRALTRRGFAKPLRTDPYGFQPAIHPSHRLECLSAAHVLDDRDRDTKEKCCAGTSFWKAGNVFR